MAARNRTGSPDKGSITAPASGVFSITPADATELTWVTRGLYIGGAGNVAVTMEDGTTATFTALAVGVVHPLRVKIVASTNTTATAILGLY